MSRLRTIALLAVLASLLALPAVASANRTTSTMLARVNAVRVQYGLPALHFSSSLAHSAGHYSRHMMHNGYFGHAARIHASRRFHTLGEILEYHRTKQPAVSLTLRDWLNSPDHRAIILSRSFSFAGAGYSSGRFQGRRATIWVMHFGRH